MNRRLICKSPPTFLGIGSMRCGSTWLYRVLKCHPDIRMSEIKEVDFFFLRPMLRHDWLWYEALFDPVDSDKLRRVRGEISPHYARLKAWQVKRIADALPDLRLTLTLRHPIERVWSQTLYDFGHLRGRDVRKVGSLELLRQFERARNRLSSDYLHIVEAWSGAFGREALHIGFFEELRSNPQGYIDGILKHIGASTPWSLPEDLAKKKVWSTNSLVKRDRDIPELMEWYIADRLLNTTERLNQLLDGRVSNWVDEMHAIRGKTRLTWRILKELNRTLLSLPEKLAYETYHSVLDVRLWLRWRRLQRRVSAVAGPIPK